MSDNCRQLLKAQGTGGLQFDNPTEVSTWVHRQFSASSTVSEASSAAERVPVDVVAAFSDSFFCVHRFFSEGTSGFDLTCEH